MRVMLLTLAAMLTAMMSAHGAEGAAATQAATQGSSPAKPAPIPKNYIAVPLTRLPSGHHLCNVTINNKKMVLVVDTGAGVPIALDDAFAGKAGIKPDETTERGTGLGGTGMAIRTAQVSFTIGTLKQELQSIYIMDFSHVIGAFEGMAEVHGVLGAGFFLSRQAVIDYRTDTMYLSRDIS